MIKTLRHKGLERYWSSGDGRLLPPAQLRKIRRILDAIDVLEHVPKDLEPFRNWRPHPLKPPLEGFWSLDVTGNYRIIFRFENGDAHDLDYLDTHG